MGTFEKIRNTSPYFLAAFAIIFIAFFVVSDMDPNTVFRRGNPKEEVVFSVNGEKVYYLDFEAKAKDLEEQQRQASKNNPQTNDQNGQAVRSNLFNQMLQETLLKQEATKAGVSVSDGEVRDVLIENPPEEIQKQFQDTTGKFDFALYQQYITNPEAAYQGLPEKERKERLALFRKFFLDQEDHIRLEKLYGKLNTLVATAENMVSPAYLKESYINDNSVANVDYISVDIRQFSDNQVNVTEDEISKYYDANKQYYTQKHQIKVKYAAFPIVALPQDSANALKKITKISEALIAARANNNVDSVFRAKANENGGESFDFKPSAEIDPQLVSILNGIGTKSFAGPIMLPNGTHFLYLDDRKEDEKEEVKASHILIRFGNNKDSARQLAQAIYKRAKSGEDFAELAKSYSADGSAQNGGDLGFISKGQTVKPFEDAIFSSSVDEITGPVETQFGFHVIKVTDKKTEPNNQYKYSEIVITPLISKQARKLCVRNANEIMDQVKNGTSFDQAAQWHHTRPVESPFLSQERPAPGLSSTYLTAMAFKAGAGKMVEPFEDKTLGIVVAQVTGERQAGVPTLADKRDEIKATLIRIKKLDLAKAKAEEIYNRVKAAGSLAALAKQDTNIKVVNAPDLKNNGTLPTNRDAIATQAFFLLNQGQLSNPIRGEVAYYIAVVNSKTMPQQYAVQNIAFDYKSKVALNGLGQSFQMWFTKKLDDADIVDRRCEIYKENY